MIIRHATPDDGSGCLEIYAPFVLDTAVSFEHDPPSLVEFQGRIDQINRTHAFLVAETAGEIAGFAYGGPHRARAGYMWSAEVSVYVAAPHRGRGLGGALYTALFALLEQQGYRTLLAGITVPNEASVGLHRSLGFEKVGIFRGVGWKAGAWQDVLWMSKPLVPPATDGSVPAAPGEPVRLQSPVPVARHER